MIPEDEFNCSSLEAAVTHIEQHKLILHLEDYAHKMKRTDFDEFEMFRKRDKDDEDLDEASRRRLVDLYRLYVPVHKQHL